MNRRLVVFVCTGNICRSPMAEYMLKDRLGPDSEWDVCSAGTATAYGMPASRPGTQVLDEQDVTMATHMSRPIDEDLVEMADVIVVMTAGHRDQVIAQYPGAREKTFLLKAFDPHSRGGDVEDPMGSGVDVYRETRDEIGAALPGLIEFLEKLELPPRED